MLPTGVGQYCSTQSSRAVSLHESSSSLSSRAPPACATVPTLWSRDSSVHFQFRGRRRTNEANTKAGQKKKQCSRHLLALASRRLLAFLIHDSKVPFSLSGYDFCKLYRAISHVRHRSSCLLSLTGANASLCAPDAE